MGFNTSIYTFYTKTNQIATFLTNIYRNILFICFKNYKMLQNTTMTDKYAQNLSEINSNLQQNVFSSPENFPEHLLCSESA